MRIASLLPGATDILHFLGLADRVVAISHSCDWPDGCGPVPARVTDCSIPASADSQAIDAAVRKTLLEEQAPALYTLDVRRLEEMRPGLVVTQGLCDVCAVDGRTVEEAVSGFQDPPALVNMEPFSLTDILQAIQIIASATAMEAKGKEAVEKLTDRIDAVRIKTEAHVRQPPRVLFLDWLLPPFVTGHWLPGLISLAGGEPVLISTGDRSRSTSWDVIAAADPDVIAIACCGYSLRRSLEDLQELEADHRWRHLRARRAGQIHVFDGHLLFSRGGPAIVDSLEWLAYALHPGVHTKPAHAPPGLSEFYRIIEPPDHESLIA